MTDRSRAINALLNLVTALTCGLALGAVWTLLAMSLRSPLHALVWAVAALAAWAMRAALGPRRWASAMLAAAATATAIIYTACLLGVSRLSTQLGMGFAETLRSSGPGLAWQIGILSLHPTAILLDAGAALLAAALVWLPGWRSRHDTRRGIN